MGSGIIIHTDVTEVRTIPETLPSVIAPRLNSTVSYKTSGVSWSLLHDPRSERALYILGIFYHHKHYGDNGISRTEDYTNNFELLP